MNNHYLKSAHSQKGFTLIELVVAFGVFSILIVIASSSFVRAIRVQKSALQLMAINDNMGITIEQMMREMRTGYNFCTGSSPLADPRFLGKCPDAATGSTELQFVTAGNVVTRYRRIVLGSGQGVIQKGIGLADWDPANPDFSQCADGILDPVSGVCYRTITADNINVTNAYFETRYNNIDNKSPRIILSFALTSNDPLVSSMVSPMTIQTTISARCGEASCPSDM